MNDSPSQRDLFERALLIEPAQRHRWLAEHCSNPDRRAVVERLLDADAAATGHAIDQPFDRLLEGIGDVGVDAPPGTRVGAFLLHEKLGEGGSSIVFRATREQAGVIQPVALKLLRRNLYTTDEQRRFRDERRALSQLDHPGIARLIEGDVTGSGTPYIALELVIGTSILEHARVHRLDLPQRLRLFIDTCRAVEAAHRALIVHRDLKPSNVLVTAQGQVKLLDFGIAKLLDADGDGVHTHTHHHAMTPAYAAPEQFRHGQITTATDVYSLGILLGELITGQRREHGDTRTPSSHLTDDTEPGVLPAAPAKMRRQLSGDLDNIVLQATAEEPGQRYASAGAFADDIQRHLANEPVVAHPPSPLYRLTKFVSRHRGGVATSAAFVLAIIGALGIALWQGHAALRAAQRANAMREFMFTAFARAEPGSPRDGSPRITEVVADAIATARADTRMHREVRTELVTRLGSVQRAQGALKPAFETLQWNYGNALADFGDRSPLTIEAGAELADSMILDGDFARARPFIDELLARVSAADTRLCAHLRMASALLATKQHERRRALDEANQGMALARSAGDGDEVAHALDDYGNVQLAVADVPGAIATYTELLAIREAQFGPRHMQVATTHANLSRAYRRSGDTPAAERHIRAALAIDALVLPKDDWRVANHLNALMFVVLKQRDFQAALDAANEGLRINTLAYGQGHPEIANDLNSVGMLHASLGDFQGALAPLRESLRLTTANWGANHYETALAHANYGAALARAGDVGGGEGEIETALALFEADSEPDVDQQAATWEKLARLRLDRHDPAAAMPVIDKIDVLLGRMPNARPFWDGRAAILRATALVQQDKPREAQPLLDDAARALHRSSDADRELSAEVLLLQARARRPGNGVADESLKAEAMATLARLRNPPARLVELGKALQDDHIGPSW